MVPSTATEDTSSIQAVKFWVKQEISLECEFSRQKIQKNNYYSSQVFSKIIKAASKNRDYIPARIVLKINIIYHRFYCFGCVVRFCEQINTFNFHRISIFFNSSNSQLPNSQLHSRMSFYVHCHDFLMSSKYLAINWLLKMNVRKIMTCKFDKTGMRVFTVLSVMNFQNLTDDT